MSSYALALSKKETAPRHHPVDNCLPFGANLLRSYLVAPWLTDLSPSAFAWEETALVPAEPRPLVDSVGRLDLALTATRKQGISALPYPNLLAGWPALRTRERSPLELDDDQQQQEPVFDTPLEIDPTLFKPVTLSTRPALKLPLVDDSRTKLQPTLKLQKKKRTWPHPLWDKPDSLPQVQAQPIAEPLQPPLSLLSPEGLQSLKNLNWVSCMGLPLEISLGILVDLLKKIFGKHPKIDSVVNQVLSTQDDWLNLLHQQPKISPLPLRGNNNAPRSDLMSNLQFDPHLLPYQHPQHP